MSARSGTEAKAGGRAGSRSRAGEPSVRVHPLIVALLPIPAIIGVLVAPGVRFGLLALVLGVLVSCFRGARFALGVIVAAAGGVVVLWTGFVISLPDEPLGAPSPVIEWLPLEPTIDRTLVALRGALRIVSIMVLYVAALGFVSWKILGDTLIDRFGVPYRLVDVSGLGGRFAVLIRRDLSQARSIARLRSRGRPLRTARLLSGLAVPVLMASFRHADELTIAMEARGFGALPDRTVHHSVPVRIRDLVVLAVVWALSIVAAVLLG